MRTPDNEVASEAPPTTLEHQNSTVGVAWSDGLALSTKSALLVGERDSWVIGKQLGRGGTATVYEATSTAGVRGVAKVLSTHRFADTPEIRRRFEREAVHLSRIDHPNVVKVLDIGEVATSKALVLERAECSLYDRLRATGDPLPLGRIVDYLVQALSGLQVLHKCGLVHRDVSPKNLLLFGNGRLAVADLGAVRHFHDTTITGGGLGSLLYISNEQFRDPRNATDQDDIFSIGQVAYEMLAGQPPHGNPEPLALACPDVPSRLIAAVESMRVHKREQRPKTAEAAAKALLIEGELAIEVAIRSAARGEIDDAVRAMRRAYSQCLPDAQLVQDIQRLAIDSEQGVAVRAATTKWLERQAIRSTEAVKRQDAGSEGASIDTRLGRLDRLCQIARAGTAVGVDYLMHELDGGNLATTKLIDYALGHVGGVEGVARIDHYLFHGTRRQRNYAALYFKRRGDRKRLERAVAVNAVDRAQAFSR